MKKFFLFFLLISAVVGAAPASTTDAQDKKISAILKQELPWVKANLPKEGILQQAKDGFIYLKVDDSYIDDLYSKFVPFGYEKPHDYLGAHISVIDTFKGKKLQHIEEIGQEYTFTIKNFRIVHLKDKNFIALIVESPDLEKLRKKYGLRPLRLNNPLHISIAKQEHAVSLSTQQSSYELVAEIK